MPERFIFLKSATSFWCPYVFIHWGMYATISQTVMLRNVDIQTPKGTQHILCA